MWISRLGTISLLLGIAVASFPENIPAISVTAVNDVRNSFFTGGDNASQRLQYVQDIKMVKIAGKDYFAVTGRETLFLIEPEQMTQATNTKIPYSDMYTWKTDDKAKRICVMKGQSEENCENYIKVVEQMDPNGNKLLICGTNSYEPKCRYLTASMNEGRLLLNESSELFSGTEKCPFGPDQTGSSLYTGSFLYSATVSDFNGRSHTIIRSLGKDKELRTPKYDDKFLNEPRFVKMVEDGDRVLVFMNELVKSENGDVRMVAYVAQVCKNDVGGQDVLVRQWTKFEKTRLNCSWNGFYFDQLQDVSDPVAVKTSAYSDSVTQTIYATFTTPEHSVPGSAVCAFTLNSIHDALLGRFREERGSNGKKSKAPSGSRHPGNCPSEQYTTSELMFLKSHPLLEDQAKGDLLTTSVGERWTAVSADTTAGPNRNWTVYFVGTDHGQVLRYLSPTGGLKNAVLLKRQDVYDATRCQNATGAVEQSVTQIIVDAERDQLLIAFKYCVISTPLRACSVHKCERSCLDSADPYCGWNGSTCIDYMEPSDRIEQNVFAKAINPTRDVDDLCVDDVAPPPIGKGPTDVDSKTPNVENGVDAVRPNEDNDRFQNGTFVKGGDVNGDENSSDQDSSIQQMKVGGMRIEIALAIGFASCLIGFVVGLCASKICCNKGKKSSDIEKQKDAMDLSSASNKDSLCKKIIASISPKRKRKGSMKPPSLSQSQSTIADNQQGEPLVLKDNSKLDQYIQHHDGTALSERYVNMPTLPLSDNKHSKSRLNSTGSGSQVTVAESVSSYTSRRRGSAQQHVLSMVSMPKKAVPNLYSTAPRPRHHSGNRTSDPSEYSNPPTLRTDKPVGRKTSRHSTPLPVSGYPTTPNSLKDYPFHFPYDQVVESTEHLLDNVKEVIEQQQRRSAEMETLVEESPDDARLRHQSSDSGKGSSPRNSLQTEEQDTVSTLSRNKPEHLVLGPPPARGRKRLNSEPTSPTSTQAPLPPASTHKPVGRSTSMRSQYGMAGPSNYPPPRTRSESFSSHHSQQGMTTGSPLKMHQMPKKTFVSQGQPNLYATLPINPQMIVNQGNAIPKPEQYNRQMSYDTYSPVRYPPYIDHSDHPAMNLPDRFSSLPSRSQAHRSSKKPYPAQPYGQIPSVQMRRSSATPQVPPYLKQMSTPVKFEQHSNRMGRGKYVPTPSIPGIPSPLPEQNAV